MDCSDEYVDARSSPETTKEGFNDKKKEQNAHSSLERQRKPYDNQLPGTQTNGQTGNQGQGKGSEIDFPAVTCNNTQDNVNRNDSDSKQKDSISQQSKAEKEDEVSSSSSNSGEAQPHLEKDLGDASLESWINISSTDMSMGNVSGDGFQDTDIRSEVTSTDNMSGNTYSDKNANEEVISHQTSTDTDAHSDSEPNSSDNHDDSDADLDSSQRKTYTDYGTIEPERPEKSDDSDAELFGSPNPVASPQREANTGNDTNELERPRKNDDSDNDLFGSPNPVASPQREANTGDDTNELGRPRKNDDSDNDLFGSPNPVASPQREANTGDDTNELGRPRKNDDSDNDLFGSPNPVASPQREANTGDDTNELGRPRKNDDSDNDLYGPDNPLTGSERQTDTDAHTNEPDCLHEHVDNDNDLYGPKGPQHSPKSEAGLDAFQTNQDRSPKSNDNDYNPHGSWNPDREEECNKTDVQCDDSFAQNDGTSNNPKHPLFNVPQTDAESYERHDAGHQSHFESPHQNVYESPGNEKEEWYMAEEELPEQTPQVHFQHTHDVVQDKGSYEVFRGAPPGLSQQTEYIPQQREYEFQNDPATAPHQRTNTSPVPSDLQAQCQHRNIPHTHHYQGPADVQPDVHLVGNMYNYPDVHSNMPGRMNIPHGGYGPGRFHGPYGTHVQGFPQMQNPPYGYHPQKMYQQTITDPNTGYPAQPPPPYGAPNQANWEEYQHFHGQPSSLPPPQHVYDQQHREHYRQQHQPFLQRQQQQQLQQQQSFSNQQHPMQPAPAAQQEDYMKEHPDHTRQKEPLKTILVEGIDSDLTEDVLEMYFESRRSRGGEIQGQIKRDKAKKTAYITYESEEVARRVAEKKDHICSRRVLKVSLYDPDESPSELDTNTVAVTGFPPTMTKDTLEMYFENKRSRGGSISEAWFSPRKDVLYIKFEKERVAEDVVAKKHHKLEGCPLTVTLQRPNTRPNWSPKTVAVTGFGAESDDDTIQMYFESKKKSGGGEIEKYHRENGVIYITFQQQEVTDRVLKKSNHHVGGMTLTVVQAGMEELDGQPEADEGDKEPATTIEIRGYDKNASNDSISLYFENKRKSGGGPATDLKRNDKKGIIYITFETEEVAKRVVTREHKPSGRLLQVKLVAPEVMCKDKVLLRNVPALESYNTLIHYMEGRTQLDVQQLLFGEEDGDVLVTFTEDFRDLEFLKNAMKERPFKERGKKVAFNIESVPETTSITVWNIPDQITEEQLKLYFENSRRSGGAEVEDVTKDSQDRSAVIKFQSAKVAESVSKRKHELMKLPVEVSLNFQCLGESGGFLEPPCSKLPATFTVSDLDEWKLRHFVENKKANVCLKEKMANANTDIDLNLLDRVATFTPSFSLNTPDARSICKTWREITEAEFTNEQDLVKVEMISVSIDIWTQVKSKMAEMHLPQEIQVFSDKGRDIVITGPEETLHNIASEIQETADGIQKQHDRKKNEIVDKLSTNPAKVRLLQMQGMLEAIQTEDLHVEVDEDKGEIRFIGQKGDVQSGKMKAYEELSKIQQQTNVSRFTPKQVELLHHRTVSEVLIRNLKDQPSPLNASWDAGKEGVIVYYITEDKIADVLRYLGTSLKEITLPLDRESKLLLTSTMFKECVSELTQAHEDRVIITPEAEKHRIVITAVSTDCMSVESVLQKFFQENSIYTVPYKCDAIQLKFVMLHCDKELAAIEKELHQHCVRFERRNKDPDFALTLKSTKAGQPHAIKLIDCITKRITKHLQYMSRPGMKGYLEGATSVLQRIERDARCVISLREANNDNPEDVTEDETPMAYEVAYICHHPNEAQLHISVGDLVSLVPDVDAVVVEVTPGLNSDSEQGWEVISRAGDEAVAEVRRLSGQMTEGDVVSSSAGALSCKMIIYAVGPTGENDPQYVIKTVVSESLETAAKKSMRSVAFPAFNTQMVSVHLSSEDALKAVVEAVHEFFCTNQHSSVKYVYLCTEDWPQCTPLWNVAMDVFGEGNVTSNDDSLNTRDSLHGGQRRGMGHRQLNASRYETDTVQEADFREASGGLEEAPPASSNRLKPRILLVKADMGVEEADVIVNSSNTHLDLSQGQVSKSLLKHAGKAIQIECKEKYPQGVPMGGIAVTKGGDMQCVEQIYHCVLPQWKTATGRKTFTDTLNALLTKTHQSNWKTMAIPALGTGNLGYSRELVAKLMYDTVIQFGKDNPETTINDVLFIVYPGDEKTIQAFEAEHRKYIELIGGKLPSSQKEIDAERDEELEAYRDKLKSDKAKRDEKAGMSIAAAVKAVGNFFISKERKRDAPVRAPRPDPPPPKQPPSARNVPKPSDVKIWIYADDDANVKKAVDMIYKDWDSKADKFSIKEKSVRLWSPDEINDLKQIEQDCGVSITVNKTLGRITLHGLKTNIPDASQKVHEMIRALDRKRKEEEYADELQRVVEWSYVELTEDGDERVVAYDKKVNALLERAYTKQKTEKLEYEGYTFDFTGWVEYPSVDPTDTVKMIRRDKVSGASANLPSTWDGMTPTDDVKIRQVPNGNLEFIRVQQTFTGALGNTPAQIRRIDRVQSKTLYQQYQAKKQQMETQNPGSQIEKTLWHGTPREATMSIMTYGFNRSYCDKENNALGEGVYFASDAAYAARDRYAPADGQGNRYMFLCKVLTGSYTKGQPQIRTPPQKSPDQPELFDSVVDDPADPKIFVIFRDTQAYPEYLISFQ